MLTTAEMIVFPGKALCSGSSAPTPFCSRTTDVFFFIMGPICSDRDGEASRSALVLTRTDDGRAVSILINACLGRVDNPAYHNRR